MPMLHDPAVRRRLESRLATLRPDAEHKWGKMTADQMLWHVNKFLDYALEGGKFEGKRPPIPAPLFRFVVLNLPWPKGAPTHPTAVATTNHDFSAERARCLALIDRFVSRPLDADWPTDPVFGQITGTFTSRLQAKHLDHHLRQFGA